jgi:hypothetical protein
MTGYEATKATWNLQLIYDAIVVIIGAGIGAIAALGIFLAVIMKS